MRHTAAEAERNGYDADWYWYALQLSFALTLLHVLTFLWHLRGVIETLRSAFAPQPGYEEGGKLQAAAAAQRRQGLSRSGRTSQRTPLTPCVMMMMKSMAM